MGGVSSRSLWRARRRCHPREIGILASGVLSLAEDAGKPGIRACPDVASRGGADAPAAGFRYQWAATGSGHAGDHDVMWRVAEARMRARRSRSARRPGETPQVVARCRRGGHGHPRQMGVALGEAQAGRPRCPPPLAWPRAKRPGSARAGNRPMVS